MNNNYTRNGNGYRKKTALSGNQQSNRLAVVNPKDKQTVSLDPREWDGTLGSGTYQSNQSLQTGATGTKNTAQNTARTYAPKMDGTYGSFSAAQRSASNNQAAVDGNRRKANLLAGNPKGEQMISLDPREWDGTFHNTYTPSWQTGSPESTGEAVTSQRTWEATSGTSGSGKKTDRLTENMAVGTPDPTGAQNAGGYEQSDAVKQAQAQLEQHLANKPGDYSSQYAQQIQQLMNQIQNRGEFSYDLNSDALYKQYAEQYMRQGQMAMMDTMGQAAAMTGGYGNSYAQTVGQQAYQGYMQQLNDVMPELYQLAADQYYREGEDLLNQYGMLVAQEEEEYVRYRDDVADYYSELQRLTEDARYQDESAYGKYIDERNYNYQEERDTVSDEQWQKQFDEMSSQWEAEYGLSRDQFEEMIRQYDSELGYQRERDAVSDSQWQAEFDEMARQWEAEYGLSRDQFEEMIRQWDEEMGYQRERDTVSDSQWEQEFGLSKAQFDEMSSQWEAEYGLSRDQFEEMIRQYDSELGYQRERDAVSDSQWQAEFDEMARQWEAEYGLSRDQFEEMIRQYDSEREYQKERDAIEDGRYDEELRYRDERDAVEDDRYDEELRYRDERDAIEDERYEDEWEYRKERDSVDDERWAQEFEEAQRQYNESRKTSGSSSGSSSEEPYEMSVSDYKYWNEQWASVTTEAQAEALGERMEAAGVPSDLVYLWYKEFLGGYEPDEEPENTQVPDQKPNKGGGNGGGGRGSNGDPIKREQRFD